MIFLNILNEKFRKLGSGSEGFAMGLTLLVWPLMLIMVSGVFVTGESVLRKVQLQNAVDASAYAGAQVQADTLSRMAMINRMMAWTYIQANKMEMDYNVRNWANLTDRAMDALKSPLANINQTLSFNCPDVAHKTERIAASGDNWGWYAGLNSSANGYLPGTLLLNTSEVSQEVVKPVVNSTAELENMLDDAYGNISAMNDAMQDLVRNGNSRIQNAARAIFERNTGELDAPELWVRDIDLAALLPVMNSERDFMLLAPEAYETIRNTPGFDQWWNLESGTEGFRREYNPVNGELKGTFGVGFKGWIKIMSNCANYLTGEGDVNVSGNGMVTLSEMRFNGGTPVDLSSLSNVLSNLQLSTLAYNTGILSKVYARPRMPGADFIRNGSVLAAAKHPMRNPLEKIFGDLTGSWYDVHTVTGQDVWCAAAARACAKHPSQAGYSRNNLASYAANTTDYAAVMLPLASAGNSAGEVLKEAADNLNVTGWDALADWSMLNRFAAVE